jgi:hypothetical protein
MGLPFYELYAILPPWLISLLGIAFLAIQVLLMIDCLRNQREIYWLWILWVFPLIGALAYWFYYRWPGSRLQHALFRRGAEKRRIDELEASATHVGNAANFEELGDALWKQRRFADAERNYRVALSKDPKLRDSRARLGYCLTALGKPAEAWPLLESVIAERRDHDHEHLLHEAARCRRRLGDLPGARKFYEEFLTRHSYFEAQVECAEVCAELGDYPEAQRICQEVITDLKHSPPYVRRRQGHFAGRAKRVLRRVKKAPAASYPRDAAPVEASTPAKPL